MLGRTTTNARHSTKQPDTITVPESKNADSCASGLTWSYRPAKYQPGHPVRDRFIRGRLSPHDCHDDTMNTILGNTGRE